MLFAKKIIRLTPFLGLVCFLTPTKAQINSPFSRYGIGTEVVNGQNATSQAMGGFSAAYTSPMNGSFGQSVNFNNPASYGTLYMTTFDLGVNFNNNALKKLTEPTGKEQSTYLSPNYIVVGLPINKIKKVGMAFGLRPLTQVNYSLTETKQITSGDTIFNNYIGQGGLNQAFLGVGKSWKYLSIGINTGINFGRKKIENIKSFKNSTDSNYFFQSTANSNTIFSGVFLQWGVQGEFPLYKIQKGKGIQKTEYSLSYGVTATLDQTMKAKQDLVRSTGSFTASTSTPLDTAIFSKNIAGNVTIPALYTAGLALHKKEFDTRGNYDQWVLGVEYNSGAWQDKYSYYGQKDVLSNSWMLRVGAQFCPNALNYESYWSTVVYRLGFYTGKDYLNIDNKGLKVSAFTLGMGMPIRKYRSYDYQYTLLNLALQIGQRGTSVNDYKENFVQFTLGYSLSDVWFNKRKYD
ncbi:MAG: hypothetical protein NTY43_06090 [Bacteroidetes bacterium]|jgi:hypothetical protein|nr:hypothetical protein [Bacteroidota bacterium]